MTGLRSKPIKNPLGQTLGSKHQQQRLGGGKEDREGMVQGELQGEHPQQPWRELSMVLDVHSVRPLEEQVG